MHPMCIMNNEMTPWQELEILSPSPLITKNLFTVESPIAFCSQLLFSATITFNSYPLNVKDFVLYFLRVCTDNYIRQWHFCPPFTVIGASKFPNLTRTPDAMGAPALPSGNLDNGYNIPGSSSSSSPAFKLLLLKELSIWNKCATGCLALGPF